MSALSVFLEVPEAAWVCANALAFAFRDRFPVSRGHTLIVTRRVVTDWFAASDEERAAVLELVGVVKQQLDAEYAPDGYNVGFNAGAAAGQTVMHLHVHVIPRYRGDMDDPRGGVRHVIPSKGNYLREAAPLTVGGGDDPFAAHVLPLFDRAEDVAIVAAFVQESGLDRIQAATEAALRRGARVRIITGNYLNITQAEALQTLLDWERLSHDGDDDDDETVRGRFAAGVIEVEKLRLLSFHPKAWRFAGPGFGVAFVGSSNISRTALGAGVEWNLRVDRDRDAVAYARIGAAFEELWERTTRLDAAWIADYARRARRVQLPLPAGEEAEEALEGPPEPHDVQRDALACLRTARRDHGRRRAIVVLATGLGKTWLAAFDYAQLAEELGRRPRLLFLAHRRELLQQAARTYRRQLRAMDGEREAARVGWFVGDASELEADLVFASVAKLARAEHVAKLAAAGAFDYVVVDEVHHAAADSYRRIIDRLDPCFLLGLTATPDRADAADVLGLFDDFVAYRADIARGIELGRLTPFHYFGVKDTIDYANIPWRNYKFDAAALAAAVETEARMATLWRAWEAHPGTRSLVFCCSVAHATFVQGWLGARGVRVAAVYAGEGSHDRELALAQLACGELDAVCAVDMFNEGIDVPAIDRVVMLRPTESSVVFLQQLGRGLRAAAGKAAVTIVDFVGNHRVFLERVRALLSLGDAASAARLRAVVESGAGPVALPAGCSVDIELEAKEALARLFRVGGADEVERAYRELVLERGADEDVTRRPTAGELYRMGYAPRSVRERHGSWFAFVRGEGGLDGAEREVVEHERAGAFLRELETTEMTKSFKMITLEVLLEARALREGMRVDELAARAHAILRRSPELIADVPDAQRGALDDDVSRARWRAYWQANPIAAWTGAQRAWFGIDDGVFRLRLDDVPAHLDDALHKLTRELVQYRLAQYRDRKRLREASSESFVCKVTWNKRDPILKLPDRKRVTLPEGETDVRLRSGAVWQFRFAKEYCNVARPAGTERNALPDLMREWFGPRAGQPGTTFQVRFVASPDGLWIEPVQAAVVDELAARRRQQLVAYPDLRAAAGHALAAVEPPGADEDERVALPIDASDPELFAVRVAGTSMDGGKQPLRDGDWAIMRVARSLPASAVENRVVLVEVTGDAHGAHYQIKRLRRDGRGWQLTSDNPDGPTFAATDAMVPIARLERSVAPEELGPATGTVVAEAELARAFGLEALAPRSDRHHGHLFVFLDEPGQLRAPDRVRFDGVTPRPSETAFVLAPHGDGAYRYLGVARQTGDRGVWALPEVDLATWQQWGDGDGVSRRLDDRWLAEAATLVRTLGALPDDRRWITQGGDRRARILGAAPRGGLRIASAADGAKPRTVSLTDLGWALAAAHDVAAHGGLLDEERVNRLRYLAGTPKGSTRWIDTGWAIAAWRLARSLSNDA